MAVPLARFKVRREREKELRWALADCGASPKIPHVWSLVSEVSREEPSQSGWP